MLFALTRTTPRQSVISTTALLPIITLLCAMPSAIWVVSTGQKCMQEESRAIGSDDSHTVDMFFVTPSRNNHAGRPRTGGAEAVTAGGACSTGGGEVFFAGSYRWTLVMRSAGNLWPRKLLGRRRIYSHGNTAEIRRPTVLIRSDKVQ